MDVRVLEGDVTMVEADVLMTVADGGGMWFGQVDADICRMAGSQFHTQARSMNHSSKVLVIPATTDHDGCFEDVIFTVDDFTEELSEVIRRGLDAAAEAGYESLSLPAVRFRLMHHAEGTTDEKVRAITKALREHEANAASPLKSVTVVVHDDPDLEHLLRTALT